MGFPACCQVNSIPVLFCILNPLKMAFNMKSPAALKEFNQFLESNSYASGFAASQADVSLFKSLGKKPSEELLNVLRWYNHISSFEKEFASLPGVPGKVEPMEVEEKAEDDDDDDVDLFGSDSEDEDAARIREERLKAYAEKKSKKPGPIAKSQILLDVKPWDDETDMKELEKNVRTIVMEGLVWGASELKPVGFGIKKLSILTTVVDDLVCVEDLTDKIEAFEDFVQSVDIAAFNKV